MTLPRLMTIGQIAKRSGLTPRSIRYYEQIGLIPGALRTESNYRLYDARALERLRFVARCRSLGFSLSEVRALCGIKEARSWTGAQFEKVVREHLELTEAKIGELLEIRDALVDRLAQYTVVKTPAIKGLDPVEQGKQQRRA